MKLSITVYNLTLYSITIGDFLQQTTHICTKIIHKIQTNVVSADLIVTHCGYDYQLLQQIV